MGKLQIVINADGDVIDIVTDMGTMEVEILQLDKGDKSFENGIDVHYDIDVQTMDAGSNLYTPCD